MDIRRQRQVSYLMITHDMAIARHFADRVAVMRHGEVVEQGEAAQIVADPRHEYTRLLLRASGRAASDFHEGPAIHGHGRPGDEISLIGSQEHGGIRDVPAGSAAPAERHAAVAFLDNILARPARQPGASVHRHGGLHPPGQDGVGSDAILGIMDGKEFSECDHPALLQRYVTSGVCVSIADIEATFSTTPER
jgi:ABC-type glutathione transport system ATPase component